MYWVKKLWVSLSSRPHRRTGQDHKDTHNLFTQFV